MRYNIKTQTFSPTKHILNIDTALFDKQHAGHMHEREEVRNEHEQIKMHATRSCVLIYPNKLPLAHGRSTRCCHMLAGEQVYLKHPARCLLYSSRTYMCIQYNCPILSSTVVQKEQRARLYRKFSAQKEIKKEIILLHTERRQPIKH